MNFVFKNLGYFCLAVRCCSTSSAISRAVWRKSCASSCEPWKRSRLRSKARRRRKLHVFCVAGTWKAIRTTTAPTPSYVGVPVTAKRTQGFSKRSTTFRPPENFSAPATATVLCLAQIHSVDLETSSVGKMSTFLATDAEVP